jgi:hypothetical protein
MSAIETVIMVEADGSAHIDAPTGLPVGRHRALLLVMDEDDARDANGWPVGFFAQTYGSCADDPLPEATAEPAQEREALA